MGIRGILAVAFGAVSVAVFGSEAGDRLEDAFDNPRQESGVNAWWHWLGSNVSKYGITRDLEAMRDAGLCGATIFNIQEMGWDAPEKFQSTLEPEMSYKNEKWWEMVRHAAAEAKRLGLELGMHNSPGYSSSGGTWITPEYAMKKLVWVKGKGKVEKNLGFYRDIARVKTSDGIYRFGYTCTGKNSHPVPPEMDNGNCLEADKLSAAAMKVHVDNLIAGILANVTPSRPGFCFLMEDSYEAGEASWTDDFAEEFRRRRGYDLIPYLPVLAGVRVRGPVIDGRVRHDYERTRNELQTERHYRYFRERFNAVGLKYHLEPYTGPFDSFEATACADVPMTEFWQGLPFWATKPQVGGATWMCGPVARALGQSVVGAESFTGYPLDDPFALTPRDLKAGFDASVARGLNRLSLHHWVHQPLDARWRPGLSMGAWGTHFGENQTWFEPGKAFYRYMQRVQSVMQLGMMRADDLGLNYTIGEDSDALPYREFLTNTVVTPAGMVRVKSSGREYPIISLNPEVARAKVARDATEVSVLMRVAEYERKGVVVCRDGDKRAALDEIGLAPAFEVLGGAEEGEVLGNARELGDVAFYFVANLTRKARTVRAAFRPLDGRMLRPELWYPATGAKKPAENWMFDDGRVVADLPLDGQEAVFVVFREEAADDCDCATAEDDLLVEIAPDDWRVSFTGCGLDGKWYDIADLASWTESRDGRVRYFSGTAEYVASFRSAGFDPAVERVMLDLGDVRDIVEVSVNGTPVSVLWYEPFVTDITAAVRDGINYLRLRVTNAWTNRLIGDEKEPEDGVVSKRMCGFGEMGTKSFVPIGRPLVKFPDAVLCNGPRRVPRYAFTAWKYPITDRDLRPAGLLGPVRIQIVR